MPRNNTLKLNLDSIQFENNGNDTDPTSHLLAQVEIAGIHHHLEAFAVELTDTKYGASQTEVNPGASASAFKSLLEAFSGPFQTVSIRGREYAIFMSPHQR